jgi:hypothetical protein
MNLSHFTAAETLTPYSVEQPDRPTMKPSGLWVSVDGEDDWPTWCRDNMFRDDASFSYRYRVTVRSTVRVLATVDEVLAFNDRYGVGDEWSSYINWASVASDYPGIIIAPYQWDLRMDWRTFWYYTWDCASGCIWDADAIESVAAYAGDAA